MTSFRPWFGLISILGGLLALNFAVLWSVLGDGSSAAPGESHLRFSQGPEIATLDPARIKALGDGRIAAALFEGLTVTDPATLSPRPGAAGSWDISDDGLTYTFHLRPEACWSDGDPLTAHDFIYSWKRVLDARTAAEYKGMLYPIKGAESYAKASEAGEAGETGVTAPDRLPQLGLEALDDKTLRVTLERPTAYFLSLAAFSTYLPVKREVVERAEAGEGGAGSWIVAGRLIGNGAYLLKEWTYKSRIRLVRNPRYWNAGNVRIETVDVLQMTTDLALVGYEKGELDLVMALPALASEALVRQMRAGRRSDVHLADNLATYFYRLNCRRGPLKDPRVRRALSLALDKRAIIEKVGRLNQTEATTFVPPNLPGYEAPRGVHRNIDEARRLLAEAGYPQGRGLPKLLLLYNTDEGHRNIAELAMQSWKKELGVEIELANLEWKVFLEEVQKGQYDIARAGWYGDYVDPNTFLDIFMTDGGNNDTGWSNERYDALIRQAADAVDPAARNKLLRRAEALLLEESPIIPIYHYVNVSLVRPTVKGFKTNLRNEILFSDLWLDESGGTEP